MCLELFYSDATCWWIRAVVTTGAVLFFGSIILDAWYVSNRKKRRLERNKDGQ